MRTLRIILGGLLLTGAGVASAASGPYVQIFGGPNFLPGFDVEIGDDLGEIDADYETGYNAGASAGYRFSDWFRLELEAGYQNHDLKSDATSDVGVVVSNLRGEAEVESVMVNAFLEADFGVPLRPFLGLGGGMARVSLNSVGATFSTDPSLPIPPQEFVVDDLVDDDDTVTAAQLILGLGYDFTDHVTAAISYRLFGGFDSEFETAGVENLVDGEQFGGTFYSHAARVGLAYRF